MRTNLSGVLGINARNLLYLRPFNKKAAVNLADDKLRSKQFFARYHIPHAKLIRVIQTKKELSSFYFSDIPNKTFVIKPNRGFGGEGIVIVRNKNRLAPEKQQELKDHIADILDGRYSLIKAPDQVLIEERIICDEKLRELSPHGLPDIRVIVHNFIPVMAMLRLATKESDGKANLHAGGIIAGLDLASGEVTYALHHKNQITMIPGTETPLKGFAIPNWNKVLLTASKAQLHSNIGYLAIDVVINKDSEPMVLEMNARGGLGIQLANKAKLRERLEVIKGLKVKDPEHGVRLGKELFGSQKTTTTLESTIERISGKEVLGSYEPVELQKGKKALPYRTVALLDSAKIYTSIDKSVAVELGLVSSTYKPGKKVKFFQAYLTIGKKKVRTFVTVKNYEDKTHKVVVGRRNLRHALIDPFKGLPETFVQSPNVLSAQLEHEKEADRLLAELYEKIAVLNYLKPLNVEEEQEKWQKNTSYIPQFSYQDIPSSYLDIARELRRIPQFDSDIGQLIKGRARELVDQIELLQLRGTSESVSKSKSLFRDSTEGELEMARLYIKKPREKRQTDKEKLDATQIAAVMTSVLEAAGDSGWKVVIDDYPLSTIRVPKNNLIAIPNHREVTKHRLKQQFGLHQVSLCLSDASHVVS